MSNDNQQPHPAEAFGELYRIVRRLRAPDGCPWDKKQTVQSLKPFLLEEVYECFEAIDDKDWEHLREELGDVFMLATMIGYIMEQAEAFPVDEILTEVNAKLIRRHPHVFGDVELATSDQVVEQWAEIKKNVEGRAQPKSVLDKVPRNLPPLQRAHQVQVEAAKVGFDWDSPEHVHDKVTEELAELKESGSDPDRREEEIGDLLFTVVNLARHYKVDPTVALHRTNNKFARRFAYVEQAMTERGEALSSDNMNTMDALWEESKERE